MSWILMFYSLKDRRESFVSCFSNFIEVFCISVLHICQYFCAKNKKLNILLNKDIFF